MKWLSWEWWGCCKKKEELFSMDQVVDLVDRIKKFNAGAIDAHLTKHVDECFVAWKSELILEINDEGG